MGVPGKLVLHRPGVVSKYLLEFCLVPRIPQRNNSVSVWRSLMSAGVTINAWRNVINQPNFLVVGLCRSQSLF